MNKFVYILILLQRRHNSNKLRYQKLRKTVFLKKITSNVASKTNLNYCVIFSKVK